MARTLDYRPPRESKAATPWWRSRGAALAAGALFALAGALAYAGPSAMVVVYRLLTDGLILLAWLASAAGLGSLLMLVSAPAEVGSRQGSRAVVVLATAADVLVASTTAVALGLGAFSLSVLGLGLAGALNRATAIGLLALGGLAGAAVILTVRRRRPDALTAAADGFSGWWRGPAGWGWAWMGAVPFLAVALAGAMVAPGILWKPDEPLGYDVVAYHLQVPREWYEAGRIIPLRHNAFSYMPFNVEVHYLLAMHLTGGPWPGMYLAQFMHLAMVVLTVLAASGFGWQFGRNRAAMILAGVAAAVMPWLTQLGAIAYNEGGFLLYSTLAIGWSAHAIVYPSGQRRQFALAGVMAGLACGTKLTAVPEVLIGVPLVWAVVMVVELSRRRRDNGPLHLAIGSPRQLCGPVIMGLAGLLVFSPWLVRNQVWAGNPVFPEAPGLLGKAHFSDVQVDRWRRAHSAQPAEQAVAARVAEGWRQVVAGWQFGYVLLPLAAIGFALARRSFITWFLAGMLLLLAVVWLGFTHLQSRFFLLAVPLCMLLIAQVDWGRWLPLALAAVLAAAVPGWLRVHGRLTTVLYGEPGVLPGMVEALGSEDVSWLTSATTEGLPPDVPVTLVGDAKVFWYARPMSGLRYRTIFDADTSGGRGMAEAWTKDVPESHARLLLVDPGELQRFANTYQPFPPPPAEWAARPEWSRMQPFVVRRGPRE